MDVINTRPYFGMLKAEGKVFVDIRKKRVVVTTTYDFVRYYQWFIHRAYWVWVDLPFHGSHITIANDKLHKNVNWAWAYKKYHGKTIEWEYDEDMIIGGFRKGFYMFYMKVFSKDMEDIKKDIGVRENDEYRGLHVTLGSIMKAGAVVRYWWPPMIEVKH